MVSRASRSHNGRMKNIKPIVVAVVWIVFTAFSLPIALEHGFFGFLTLSAREPWALQMLLDLFIALSLFAGFVIKDAKEKGLRAWPWLIAMLVLGSIGALPYLLYRSRFPVRA
jgi:hypothetical protein